MVLEFHPFTVNEKGHLQIDDVDAIDLARTYGTPLFVYDVSLIRKKCRQFVDTFEELGVQAQVAYASKAFSSLALFQVIHDEGLSLDVVSAGELYAAIKAGFPSEKIHFHGNNKSEAELKTAIDEGVGCIIIDNFYEIKLLEKILYKSNKKIDVLLRITPGIESETHRYIMTGNEDSKFGFNIENGQADEAFLQVVDHSHLRLKGIHSHIGSQIFTSDSFSIAIELSFKLIEKWHKMHHFIPKVMNFGGGFGIRYTEGDHPLPIEEHVRYLVRKVTEVVGDLGISMPEIWIEPGRSIVGEAGVTLYSIGSMKDIEGVRKYVAVDGGMADNIRPALYSAKYEGVIANKAKHKVVETVSIAGKCCESGDMLIWDLPLPQIDHGDILAVFSTGAYGYSMASNYNRLPKPGVVFVENGKSQLVVQRESLDDMIKNERFYQINKKGIE